MGYAKKASTRSLLAGLGMCTQLRAFHAFHARTHSRARTRAMALAVFGGCYAASAYFITQGDAQRGFRFALGNSAALAVAMGYRFVKSKKFMPAGT